MPRIRITKGTKAGGRVVFAGDVVDVSDKEAALLERMGKAVFVDGSKPKRGGVLTYETYTGQTQDRDPVPAQPNPEPSDDQPKPRRGRRNPAN